MSLKKVVIQMRKDVGACDAAFAAARAREPALASFAHVTDLVAELPMMRQTPEQTHAVTMALVREHGRGETRLWASLLVIAYEPRLRTLCSKLGLELDADDREQMIVAAFFEAVRAAGAHAYVRHAPGFLSRTTQLNFVHELTRKSTDEIAFVPFDEDKTLAEPRLMFEHPVNDIIERRERIEQAIARGVPREFAPGVALGRGIAEAVAAAHPDATRAERRRIARRIVKVRARLAKKTKRSRLGVSR